MRLVIGGAYQGKLYWLLQQTGYTSSDVAYTLADAQRKPILAALHLEIRKLLEEGREPMREVEALLQENPAVAVVCDEIGCGVVPVDAFERAWARGNGACLLHVGGKGCARRPGLLWDCHLPQTGGNPHDSLVVFVAAAFGFPVGLCFGDPHWMPHSVPRIGWLIAWLERLLRGFVPQNAQRRAFGGRFFGCVGASLYQRGGSPAFVGGICGSSWALVCLGNAALYQLLAAKALRVESMKVYDRLRANDFARRAAGGFHDRGTRYTGAHRGRRDQGGPSRRSAENTSDGEIAPAVVFGLSGAPLGLFYKAVNTMDSMVDIKRKVSLFWLGSGQAGRCTQLDSGAVVGLAAGGLCIFARHGWEECGAHL